jgi:thioredoxin-related protein
MCGANPLANPVLTRLHQKYATADFSIVSIYTGETLAQVKQYINANKLVFPVYISDLKTRKAFKTVGTPNFYLVDKSGNIIKSLGGYNDDMERDLSKLIDKELAN